MPGIPAPRWRSPSRLYSKTQSSCYTTFTSQDLPWQSLGDSLLHPLPPGPWQETNASSSRAKYSNFGIGTFEIQLSLKRGARDCSIRELQMWSLNETRSHFGFQLHDTRVRSLSVEAFLKIAYSSFETDVVPVQLVSINFKCILDEKLF